MVILPGVVMAGCGLAWAHSRHGHLVTGKRRSGSVDVASSVGVVCSRWAESVLKLDSIANQLGINRFVWLLEHASESSGGWAAGFCGGRQILGERGLNLLLGWEIRPGEW